MASFQASSTIEYLSSHKIGQGVVMNTIAFMNLFATSKLAFCCEGTFWSVKALGFGTFWSPLDLRSRSASVDGAQSEADNLLRRVDFGCLRSGDAIAPARFC